MSELKPTDADRARAQNILSPLWYILNGNGVDRPKLRKEIEDTIALALAEQRERDAQVVCDGLIVFSLTNSQVDAIARTIREGR